MRAFRTVLYLAIVVALLPSPPEDEMRAMAAANSEDPPATEFLGAAVQTVADMRDFCSRRPSVCDTAHFIAVKLESKAKYSVRLIYEWANESSGAAVAQQALAIDPVATGSVAQIAGADAAGDRGTLRLEDLIPAWRAPPTAAEG